MSDGSGGATYWTLLDHLNTVQDIVTYSLASHETTLAQHNQFNSFGVLISTPRIETIALWTGRLQDYLTKKQSNRERWYDALLARWMSEDPISFQAGDVNLYWYCVDNPLSSIDPMGLERRWVERVDGRKVEFRVMRGEWSFTGWIDGSAAYPGPWGQLASQTSGSFQRASQSASTTVNLEGANVCNTIIPQPSGSDRGGEIQVRVHLGPGCYQVSWMWEVTATGDAPSGKARVTAPSGTTDDTRLPLPMSILQPGFHEAGTELTVIAPSDSSFPARWVDLATYEPTLSRYRSSLVDWSDAISSATGMIRILEIKEIED